MNVEKAALGRFNKNTIKHTALAVEDGVMTEKHPGKIVVLDTNFLIDFHPDGLGSFKRHDILVIPMTVIEELDDVKRKTRQHGDRAQIAKMVCSHLNKKVLKNSISLIVNEYSSKLAARKKRTSSTTARKKPSRRLSYTFGHVPGTQTRVVVIDDEFLSGMNIINDNKIVRLAVHLREHGLYLPSTEELKSLGEPPYEVDITAEEKVKYQVMIASEDSGPLVRSRVYAIGVHHHEDKRQMYSGMLTVNGVFTDVIDRLHHDGKIPISLIHEYMRSKAPIEPNRCVKLLGPNRSSSALCIHKNGELIKVDESHGSNGQEVKPKNAEQRFALELLWDPEIDILTLSGVAGTGKTLLAVTAGLLQATEEHRYGQLIVARPIVPDGEDLGFLPGTLDEKLEPWMGAIYDNVRAHYGQDSVAGVAHEAKQTANGRGGIGTLKSAGLLEVGSLLHIRGRTLPYRYFILDEAQNLTPRRMKTVVTRLGVGSKLIVTGDVTQIDDPKLHKTYNGFSYLVERFRGYERYAHVTLTKVERSRLAEEGGKRL